MESYRPERPDPREARTNVKPTVLVATTTDSFSPARLAMAFVKAGCTVGAICPSGQPLRNTSAVGEIHTYSALRPFLSFARAFAPARRISSFHATTWQPSTSLISMIKTTTAGHQEHSLVG